jgi:hypothetical protein
MLKRHANSASHPTAGRHKTKTRADKPLRFCIVFLSYRTMLFKRLKWPLQTQDLCFCAQRLHR